MAAAQNRGLLHPRLFLQLTSFQTLLPQQTEGLLQEPGQKVGWGKQIWQLAPGQTLLCFEGRERAKRSYVPRKQEERQGEGREGSTAVSLSPERHCLCQPQQRRSTFCCDRVFSVIDPNYRSQPARTERVTGVSPAAARSLEMRLPKSIQNEGQELGLRAAGMVVDADSGAASLGEPGTYRDLCAPHVTSQGPQAPPQYCPVHSHLLGAAHSLFTAFPFFPCRFITGTGTSQQQKTRT